MALRRPWWLPNGVAAVASKRSCPMKATGQPREPPRDRPGAEMWPKRLPKGCPQSSKNGAFSASIATLAFLTKTYYLLHFRHAAPLQKEAFCGFFGGPKKRPAAVAPQVPQKWLLRPTGSAPKASGGPRGLPPGTPEGVKTRPKLASGPDAHQAHFSASSGRPPETPFETPNGAQTVPPEPQNGAPRAPGRLLDAFRRSPNVPSRRDPF